MSKRAPLYPTLLRLKHVHPNGWQRAVLGEGAIVVAGLLVLADVATAWALVVVPLAVALVVKAHDVMTGLLRGAGAPPGRAAAAPLPAEQGASRGAEQVTPGQAPPSGGFRSRLGTGEPPTAV